MRARRAQQRLEGRDDELSLLRWLRSRLSVMVIAVRAKVRFDSVVAVGPIRRRSDHQAKGIGGACSWIDDACDALEPPSRSGSGSTASVRRPRPCANRLVGTGKGLAGACELSRRGNVRNQVRFVRQSFAREYASRWVPTDVRGIRWTGRCGVSDRRMPEAVRPCATHRFVQRRGRDSNLRPDLEARNGFRDDTNLPICRVLASRSQSVRQSGADAKACVSWTDDGGLPWAS